MRAVMSSRIEFFDRYRAQSSFEELAIDPSLRHGLANEPKIFVAPSNGLLRALKEVFDRGS
jgi:hypothetical protein